MNTEDTETNAQIQEHRSTGHKRIAGRHRLYTKLADLAVRRPWTMLGLALVATLIAAAFASRLELRMQFKNMMPQSHPTVLEYDRIVDQYSSASSLIVVVRGKEDEIKSFANELAPRLRAMKDYIRRVDYKLDTDFVRRHGFMLLKAKDLENMQNQFADLGLLPFLTHLNDSFEKTYVADNESISNSDKEEKAVRALGGIGSWLQTMQDYVDGSGSAEAARGAVDQFLIGDPYYIAPDNDMLLMFAQPTFTLNDVETMVTAVDSVDALIADLNRMHPDVDAGITGTMALGRDEMEAAMSDMYITSIVAFILIIGLFIISFRMWAAPILAGISLAVGIIWAAGFSAVTVGSLNLMTSMFAVILIGLGIDYNIHVISAYSEHRSEGQSIGESLRLALTKSGNGIVVGAVSTALAFLTMLISENLGMKEFGLVAGIGVMFCMLASMLVLPSLLVARDRILARRKGHPAETRSIAYHWTGRLAEGLASRPVPVLSVLVLVSAFLLYNALHITFDYNYLNMEPKGLRSIQLQDDVIDEFDVTPDMLLVTANSVEKSRTISESAKELKSVGMVTSISDFVPSPEEREKRLPFIQMIRSDLSNPNAPSKLRLSDSDALVDQLYRLEDNVIELGQLAYMGGQEKVDRKTRELVGNLDLPATERQSLVTRLVDSLSANRAAGMTRLASFESDYAPRMREEALEMTSEETIDVPDLPPAIRNQFVSNDGSSYLVSIYPRQQVWDFEFLGRLTEQMHRIDPRITGLPPIFYILIQYIGRDGRTAAILALGVIFLLLLLDFRRLSLAVMAMTTLGVGVVWMVGLMHLLGMQFNIVNTIAIPLILGIGIDDSVHILNRYLEEGPGHLRVAYASTGKAVILTSLTTMIAFGSLGFAVYRGLASLGLTLLIGVGTALVVTLLLLPVLVGFLDRRALRGENGDASRRETKEPTALVGAVGCMLLVTLAGGTARAQNATPDVTDIVRKIDANERTASSYSVGSQIITTSSGSKRTLDVEFYSIGQNEKTLTVYTGPARVKGDKILMLHDGDDIWFYTPKTDRVRHLASHARRQRVQGSEFSYEDMISGNLADDYTSKLLGKEELDGIECYKVESTPTESGPSYSKIVVWADVDRFVTRRIDYYEDGTLLKRLIPTDIREVGGHYLPFRLDMSNLRDGGETAFEFDRMDVGVELNDRLFTTTNLKRR
ncbi:MAG: outer membrane lipoprotein-sorting protein [Rhodothermales bacterium]